MPKALVEIDQLSKRYLLHSSKGDCSTLRESVAHGLSLAKEWILHPTLRPIRHEKPAAQEFWALRDISFTIAEGDRFAIIGRNGAGKSTLLKVLSRIVAPTSGAVKVRGRVASLLEVGTGFHPELTGRENIYLNGAILGMGRREIQSKFDEIVAFAEIARFLDTPVKRYSSGMHARLGFAIAAHLDPDLLIVDEVLAVGDAQFQEKCLQKMNALGRSGRTIIFVSHDIGAVLSLCNNGVLLEQGQLTYCGPIQQCANAYVQKLQQRSMVWEGDIGDDTVRVSRAEIALADPAKEFFFQGQKAKLCFEYEVFNPTADLYFSVEIRSLSHVLLARAQTSEDIEQLAHFGQVGRHTASFDIDTALFHEGEYLVSLQCVIHNHKIVFADDIVLKLLVYASKKPGHVTTVPQRRAGVFLGHYWSFSHG